MRTVVLTMAHLHLPVDERCSGVLPEAQDGGVTRNKLIITHGKSSQDKRGQVTRKDRNIANSCSGYSASPLQPALWICYEADT